MDNTIMVPGEAGEVSDGYHTFNELYNHRHMLLLALMASHPGKSWFAPKHHDNTMLAGWFVAGMDLPTGQITYHVPLWLWPLAEATGSKRLKRAPEWDGHGSIDVLKRLEDWAEAM